VKIVIETWIESDDDSIQSHQRFEVPHTDVVSLMEDRRGGTDPLTAVGNRVKLVYEKAWDAMEATVVAAIHQDQYP